MTVRKTFYWTYFGSALGGIWLMCLGALLAAWAGKDFETVRSINAAGDKVFSGFGAIVLLFSTALGLISVTALNMYGGSLTLISAIDSFKRVRPTVAVRLVTIGLTAALSVVGALASTAHFLENFNNFLLLVLYLFIPWTAVNLMDYYVVRRGHYAVAEIFNPHGIYGRWGWHGIIAYLVGFAVMVPFFSVGTLFVGPAAHALGGADIACSSGCPSPRCSTGCSPGRSTSMPRPAWPRRRSRRWNRRPMSTESHDLAMDADLAMGARSYGPGTAGHFYASCPSCGVTAAAAGARTTAKGDHEAETGARRSRGVSGGFRGVDRLDGLHGPHRRPDDPGGSRLVRGTPCATRTRTGCPRGLKTRSAPSAPGWTRNTGPDSRSHERIWTRG